MTGGVCVWGGGCCWEDARLMAVPLIMTWLSGYAEGHSDPDADSTQRRGRKLQAFHFNAPTPVAL